MLLGGHTDMQSERQTDRRTDRQTDKQTDNWMENNSISVLAPTKIAAVDIFKLYNAKHTCIL